MIGLLSIFKDVATIGSLTACGYKFSMTFLAVLKAVEPETIGDVFGLGQYLYTQVGLFHCLSVKCAMVHGQ